MPMFIYLKTPNIVLLAEDSLDDKTTDYLGDLMGGAIIIRMSGHKALLPLKADCNIAYIKEITQEEANDFRKKREQEQASRESGRVVKPEMMIPRLRKGGN